MIPRQQTRCGGKRLVAAAGWIQPVTEIGKKRDAASIFKDNAADLSVSYINKKRFHEQ
jgi:hypothetical protein